MVQIGAENPPNFIRPTIEADKTLDIKELEHRRIISLSWAPVDDLYSIRNFSSVSFKTINNRVKLSAKTHPPACY
jgi:hypothetical protein